MTLIENQINKKGNHMKIIHYSKYGAPELLKLKNVAKPTPKNNEILVKVHATSVTVADVRVRGFDVPASFWLPARLALGIFRPRKKVLGAELAGTVEAVGRDVTKFKPGDKIFAAMLIGFGAYAEYVCIAEDKPIAFLPKNLTFEEAATIPVGARTALHYFRRAGIKPGQKVLIYGASGSVGTYAVQLAKYFGAEVTAVCSGKNMAMVKALGADHVIDYTAENFADRKERFDILFETVGKTKFADCLKVLKQDGVYLNIVRPFPSLEMRRLTYGTHKRLIMGDNPPESTEDLVFLGNLAEQGKLKPVIDRCYPMNQIVDAHHYVETGRKKGNVAISIMDSAGLPQVA